MKLRKKKETPCGKEFLEFLTTAAAFDYEQDHPKVIPSLKALDACFTELVCTFEASTLLTSHAESHSQTTHPEEQPRLSPFTLP